MKNALLVALWSTLLIACSQPRTAPLTIATSANMQFAIEEITQTFTQQTGIPCETVVGSSGKLTAQIQAGAPFDVFVSADMKYPTVLFKSRFTTAAPEVYAYGQLVLWSTADSISPLVAALKRANVRHIALANPATAPYGAAAEEALKYYGIYERVQDKLVFGESIAQVNQFVSSRAADIGFTARAVVVSPEMKGKGRWQAIDTTAYSPIAQGVVILAHEGRPKDEAQWFRAFLLSEEGQKLLRRFGYATDS